VPSEDVRQLQVRVGRPPFAYRVSGPDDWLLLETEPNAWQPSVERILAGSRPALARLSASERRQLRDLLETVVVAAQQTGVVLSLVKLARAGADGELFCGSLALSWYDSAPVMADMEFCRMVAGDAEELEEFDGTAGPALLRCEAVRHQEPWDTIFPGERAYVAQGFVPVEKTSWTALVTGTVSSPSHGELLRKLVRRMAGSVRVVADAPEGPEAPEEPDAPGRPDGGTARRGGGPPSRFGTQRVIDRSEGPSGMDGRWRRPLG
jgi:hypothetical protein